MKNIELQIARYEFTFNVTKPFSQGDYAGSMLRGIFGHALKKITCITKAKECKTCLMFQNCTYPAIFETPPQTHVIQQFSNAPNPYIIEPNSWGRKNYQQGDAFKFSMVLTGSALEQLSLLILTWQQAFKMGVGRERGEAELVSVDFITPQKIAQTIYIANEEKIIPHDTIYPFNPNQTTNNTNQITIRLLSLLRLQKHSKGVGPEKLKARDFLVTLMRRINLMMEFHHKIILIDNFHHYNQLADKIILIHSTTNPLTWHNWTRYSNRQKQKMLLGGIIGEFKLEGELTEFFPYLQLGEYLHLGKNTVFGLGQYKLN